MNKKDKLAIMDQIEKINNLEERVDKINNILIGFAILFFSLIFLVLVVYALEKHDQSNQLLQEKIKNPPEDIKSYCTGKASFITGDRMSHSIPYESQIALLTDVDKIYSNCVENMVKLEMG